MNEGPSEYFKKPTKSKVFPETSLEVTNSPSRRNSIAGTSSSTEASEPFRSTETIFSNSIIPESVIGFNSPSTEAPDELLDTTLKTNTLDLPNDTSEEIGDFSKTVPQATTTKPSDTQRSSNGSNRRSNNRSKVINNPAENKESNRTPETSRNRARTRITKIADSTNIPNPVPSRVVDRSVRRRPGTLPEDIQTDTRSKLTRKTEIPADIPVSRNREVRRRTATPATPTVTRGTEESTPRNSFRNRPTFSSRSSIRLKDSIPIIDEQKLEVLPLFESEPKTVRPPTRSRSREKSSKTPDTTTQATSRSSRARARPRTTVTAEENFLTSATENDLRFTKPIQSPSIVSVSVNVETRTESSLRRKLVNKKPHVKESVVSEITEVTSKRSIPRRKNNIGNPKNKAENQSNKIREKIHAFRGHKRSEVKLNEIKKAKGDNSDEIDESDNYPEPFKALIQSKKTQVKSVMLFH